MVSTWSRISIETASLRPASNFRLVRDYGEAEPVSPARRRFAIAFLRCTETRMESHFGGAI
jgi:hypothetical protein